MLSLYTTQYSGEPQSDSTGRSDREPSDSFESVRRPSVSPDYFGSRGLPPPSDGIGSISWLPSGNVGGTHGCSLKSIGFELLESQQVECGATVNSSLRQLDDLFGHQPRNGVVNWLQGEGVANALESG